METLIGTLISFLLLLQSSSSVSTPAQTTKPAQPRPISNGSVPAVSPNGSHVVFSSNRSGTPDLFVISANGSAELQLTHTPEYDSFAGWSADSKRILFSVFKNDASTIYTIDRGGNNQRLIGIVPGRNPMASPDGKHLLYTSGTWTEMRLLLCGIDGSN